MAQLQPQITTLNELSAVVDRDMQDGFRLGWAQLASDQRICDWLP